MAAFIPKILLPISLIVLIFVAASMAEQDGTMSGAAADFQSADDSSSSAELMAAAAADKRIPHPNGWRQPGRVRTFHALEMPDFSRGRFNRFFDYAQRPLFVRYMRSFAAPGK